MLGIRAPVVSLLLAAALTLSLLRDYRRGDSLLPSTSELRSFYSSSSTTTNAAATENADGDRHADLVALARFHEQQDTRGAVAAAAAAERAASAVVAATNDNASGSSSAASAGIVSGFQGAPPSCRIADLPDDPLVKEYGQNNIRLSRTYEGSGTRTRAVLQRALNGEKIKIAAVGGSVSAGHSVQWPHTSDNHMYKRIWNWFMETFPGVQHSVNYDSAVPAVSAWYFSYCVMATLPQDADIIFLELDINQWAPEDPGVLENTERLYRSLLALPKKPAVIYLSTFGLVFADMTHGWRSSALISQWLDVPEINIRNWYLPHIMQKPEDIPFLFKAPKGHVDKRHMNKNGHRALADMAIAYLREQLCLLQRGGPVELEPAGHDWPGNQITLQLPRLGMLSKWSETATVPELHPKCETVSSKTAPLVAADLKGWELVNRNDKKSYEASVPGSEITFNVTVVEGVVGLFVWRTPFEGFGGIACWVDDDHTKIKRTKAFTLIRPAASFEHTGDMFKNLSPGMHKLTCRNEAAPEGGTVFRISAVVAR